MVKSPFVTVKSQFPAYIHDIQDIQVSNPLNPYCLLLKSHWIPVKQLSPNPPLPRHCVFGLLCGGRMGVDWGLRGQKIVAIYTGKWWTHDGNIVKILETWWKITSWIEIRIYIYLYTYACIYIYIYIQCIHSFQSKTMEHGGNMMEALWSNGNNTQYMESDGRWGSITFQIWDSSNKKWSTYFREVEVYQISPIFCWMWHSRTRGMRPRVSGGFPDIAGAWYGGEQFQFSIGMNE